MDQKPILVLVIFILIGISAVILNQPTGNPPQTEENPQTVPPIYVSIITHNEEPSSSNYPDFIEDENAFWEHREALITFADMLHEEGVKYNYQSDWNFLYAATLYDQGTPSTKNKNFLRYLKEDLGFEIDPHNHKTEYNFADVAYLIEELGVPVSQTVGGFLAAPPRVCMVEYFREPIRGTTYTDYTWQANILWGGATAGHKGDEELWTSGIWRPRDNENFLVHDENALPHVGGYKSDWTGLEDLIQKQQNGELEVGKIYTQTIFIGQNELLKSGRIRGFREMIQSLSEYSDAGMIRWVGLEEVVDIWENDYDSEPNLYSYVTAVEKAPDGKGECGDGICKGIETSQNCPEDC
jgi:hypothetical protein